MNERRGTKGLELWCRKMTEGYPGVKIDNMTTSWRNGLAFCAMIHHFRPDLIDFSKLNKDDVYHNNELAFRVAEQYLGIPALLEPEDMVEYTVPDRLSILTYLSQFYQAFAVREGASAARIAPKRPQVSSDHGIVSPASTSPPTKMALTSAGKLRREPCAKCALPVFIAERLNVGKSLFHRTCFRCARCNSQLTLANYYETENSEFCCEICPDEEKTSSKTSAQKALLQRSVSDEEKTANLKSFSDEPDEFSAEFESVLENADTEKIQTLSREFDSARSNFFQSQIKTSGSSGSEVDDKDEEPPDLPGSLSPAIGKTDSAISAKSDSQLSFDNSLINMHQRSADSARHDSGFPYKNNVNSEIKVTLNSDRESQNVVTKDESSEESLVKTRRRLFENNVTDIKADVNRKTVPLSTFTSLSNSINNDISNVSDIVKDNPHSQQIFLEKYSVKRPVSEGQSPTRFSSSMSLEMGRNVNNDQQQNAITASAYKVAKTSSMFDKKIESKVSSLNDTQPLDNNSSQSINDNTEGSKSNDTAISNIISLSSETDSTDEIIKIVDESIPENQSSSITSSDVCEDSDSKINESKLLSSSKSATTIDESFRLNSLSVNSTEDSLNQHVCSDSFVSQTDQIDIIEATNNVVQDSVVSCLEGTAEVVNYNVNTESNPAEEVTETINYEVKENRAEPEDQAIETIDYNVKEPNDKKETVAEAINTKVCSEKSSNNPVLEKMKSYPEDLNPFEDEEKDISGQSLNPFGSDDEEEIILSERPVASQRLQKKKILDASDARKIWDSPMRDVDIVRISVNPFESDEDDKPVPAVRKKKISIQKICSNPFSSDDDEGEGEGEGVAIKPVPLPRNPRTSGNQPDTKPKEYGGLVNSNLLFGSNSSISSGSYYGSTRKKRPAPKPPIPGFVNESNANSLTSASNLNVLNSPRALHNQRKLKKAPLPPKFTSTPNVTPAKPEIQPDTDQDIKQKNLENEKVTKDEVNRNRQSQNVQNNDDPNCLSAPNKSTFGKWKRKKGQAPTKPVPQRRTIKCLPTTEIKKELEFIEIQQQGLEKQGVRLEQIIREKCEGSENTDTTATNTTDDDIPIEVEDLILQLFELVNEKNELFRKQTELMYLRRQQRLEEEHADVEYQIRCLMVQPEANKTDSDKAREEELIKRLVEIVERRNEIVECLEMDRVREAEEDDSINSHINLFTLSRENDKSQIESPQKEKGKDKKKHKRDKKSKHKKDKIDADKDIDTSETLGTLEKKKKKKFNIF